MNLKKRHFKAHGSSDRSYEERIFELDSSRRVLAGIRHVGGDPNLPFVSVTAGFRLIDVEDVYTIGKIVRNEFSTFNPKYFAFWLKSASVPSVFQGRLKPGNRYLARRLEALDLVLEGPDGFEVRPVTDESYLPWYESEYHKFHLSNPHLKSWVAMSEREDLEKYRNQELLYGAYLGSELIGLIGGEERPLLGLSGLYLGELLISEKYKGKGFATQMQRLYLKSSLVNLRLFGERSMLAIFNPRRPLCVWVDCRCALNTL